MELLGMKGVYGSRAGAPISDEAPTFLPVMIPYLVRDNGVSVGGAATRVTQSPRSGRQQQHQRSQSPFSATVRMGASLSDDMSGVMHRSQTLIMDPVIKSLSGSASAVFVGAAAAAAGGTMRSGTISPRTVAASALFHREQTSTVSGGGGGGASGRPNSRFAGSTSNKRTQLTKPSLDPAHIRWCPTHLWVPDAQVVNCMAPDCGTSFSLFNRKHRCKMCGLIFCSSCCSNTVIVPATAATTTTSATTSNAAKSSPLPPPLPLAPVSVSPPSPIQMEDCAAPLPFLDTPASAAATGGWFPRTNSYSGHQQVPDAATAAAATTLADAANLTASNAGFAAAPTRFRVCNACQYELQLAVSTRKASTGERRRKSRGELKMFQRALMVNVFTFLSLKDLAEASLVSSDFYFLTKDNVIWYQYNMARWAREGERPRTALALDHHAARQRQQRSRWYSYGYSAGSGAGAVTSAGASSAASAGNHTSNGVAASGAGGGGGSANGQASDVDEENPTIVPECTQVPQHGAVRGGATAFRAAPLLQDATALSESEAAKRAISLHARYNFTQFLDFTRRQEMARCEGLSSFSIGARILFSGPVKIAIVGPSRVGKTPGIRAFVNDGGATARGQSAGSHPTLSFTRYIKTVRLHGGLATDVTLHIYDLSGNERYEELRRFVCRQCHAVGLCYDPCRKVTLVEAADIMMGIEPALGPQPVVVCGLIGAPDITTTASASLPSSTVPMQCLEDARTGGPTNSESAEHLPIVSEPPVSDFILKEDYEEEEEEGQEKNNTETEGTGADEANTEQNGEHRLCLQVSQPSSSRRGSRFQSTPPSAPRGSTIEVSEEDALGITVRGKATLQCPVLHTESFYQTLIQCLLDRLALATMGGTTSIADITHDIKSGGADEERSAAQSLTKGPKANLIVAQDLLNLTTQPSALDILLDC